MHDLNVIDDFMADFIRYIDGGFGLLGPDVGFLTSTLIGIDVTLAGLFWTLGGEQDVMTKFLRKILYVGAFAFILNRFSTLSEIIFRSFATMGLTAGGGNMSAEDLLRPGQLAGTGFTAAWPLLEQVAALMGFTSFFDNFLSIAILLFAWTVVILAFFILAVQMFVTIIEFKLTSLAGFVLVPFALWNRTGFLAERVLGHIVGSGIKVMVLAVIVGIGSGYFTAFTSAAAGQEPGVGEAMSLMLAALALFGLGIFGPSVASGLIAGGPQLGAGAATGTVIGAASFAAAGGAAAYGAARAGLAAVQAGTYVGAAAAAAYGFGREAGAGPGAVAGLAGVAQAASGIVRKSFSNALGLESAAASGSTASRSALSQGDDGADQSSTTRATPAWARSLRRQQTVRHYRHLAAQAVGAGERGGSGITADIREKDD
ncbi:P-type conjugative transfer protein TrbL [Sphingobium phenoxybenzoativorans]|uniref:P-type conjugative transfer protein TrbL n=1 Tax=Sphingobium phenoxybenzoativorans TaxID=1592790 RepID=UPI000873305D|nr:P-type conjugative transfer protein TrbL [Sphingobium phenoxybenzoativorans]